MDEASRAGVTPADGERRAQIRNGTHDGTPTASAAALTTGAVASGGSGRIEAIDFARGVAVCLMILSHGINGVLSFEQFTSWGMVPIHAITKFASSLFIMVFGIALAVAFVPHTGTPEWPRKRLKLLINAVIVLFWYKVLTVVEMFQFRPPEEIIDALLYRAFPSYVEILGFYAIALLWLPWLLPLWARAPAAVKWAGPVVMALLSWLLLRHFGFWGSEPLQALLVEHPDYYTWGQLARGPLVLIGLIIGGMLLHAYHDPAARRRLAAMLGGVSLLLFACFALVIGSDWHTELLAIARNAGKHPPEFVFMLFSMGGATGILALAFLGGERLAALLRPITIIGTNALQAFVFHIVVIFVGWRFLLGYLESVTYTKALTMTLLLIGATALWIRALAWIQRRS